MAAATLETWPLLIVRHAKAKPRSSWSRPRATARWQPPDCGRRRRSGGCCRPGSPRRVVTSPWLRCVATIVPLRQGHRGQGQALEALTEHRPRTATRKRRPPSSSGLFDKQQRRGAVHAPARAADRLSSSASTCLPRCRPSCQTRDPFLAPGEIIVCHVSHRGARADRCGGAVQAVSTISPA